MEKKRIGVVEKSEKNSIVISIGSYKEKTYLDIREYWFDEEGEGKPTKKGITLSKPEAYEQLVKILTNEKNRGEILKELEKRNRMPKGKDDTQKQSNQQDEKEEGNESYPQCGCED